MKVIKSLLQQRSTDFELFRLSSLRQLDIVDVLRFTRQLCFDLMEGLGVFKDGVVRVLDLALITSEMSH